METRFPILFKAGQALTNEERQALTRGAKNLKSCLDDKADQKSIARLLIWLFNAMKTNVAGHNIEIMSKAYVITLEGMPYEVVKAAIFDIITGQVKDMSKIFAPTTAQLRAYCDELEQRTQAQIKYAQRLLQAEEEGITSKIRQLDQEKKKQMLQLVNQNLLENSTKH